MNMLQHMVQKPIAISVIAVVIVAGILMLAILATISSTNHVFAHAKPTILSGSSPTSGQNLEKSISCAFELLPAEIFHLRHVYEPRIKDPRTE
jgi:methionine-rich copper-binding protein CopC